MYSTELLLIKNYTHLNVSFNRKLGILNGKGAVVLLFSSLNYPFSKEVCISLLEEVLSEININTPVTFGDGLSGLGCLIEHLSKIDIIRQDTSDLLKETESTILKSVISKTNTDLSINKGLSGLGIFFIKKYNSKYSNSNLERRKYVEILDNIANQIIQVIDEQKFILENSYSIWNGLPGTYLFLYKLSVLGIDVRYLEPKLMALQDNMLLSIIGENFNWSQVEVYYVMLCYPSLKTYPLFFNKVLSKFTVFIEEAIDRIREIKIHEGAFFAMLLKLISERQGLSRSRELADNIVTYIDNILTDDSIRQIFPFNKQENSVPIGLLGGTCGMALPLISLETNTYDWLEII